MRIQCAFSFVCAALAASMAGAVAAGTGQAAVRGLYATYVRDQDLSSKSIADYRPYLMPDLYALLRDHLAAKPDSGTGLDCGFDADPIANTQNGAPADPITVGAAVTVGGRSYLPVDVSLKFHSGIQKNATHLLAAVAMSGGSYRVSDLVPVVDGKSYPKDSLRANLLKFKSNPKCRM